MPNNPCVYYCGIRTLKGLGADPGNRYDHEVAVAPQHRFGDIMVGFIRGECLTAGDSGDEDREPLEKRKWWEVGLTA